MRVYPQRRRGSSWFIATEDLEPQMNTDEHGLSLSFRRHQSQPAEHWSKSISAVAVAVPATPLQEERPRRASLHLDCLRSRTSAIQREQEGLRMFLYS
jgi:hypothetical protein